MYSYTSSVSFCICVSLPHVLFWQFCYANTKAITNKHKHCTTTCIYVLSIVLLRLCMVVVGKVGDDKLWRNEKDLSWLYIYVCLIRGGKKKKRWKIYLVENINLFLCSYYKYFLKNYNKKSYSSKKKPKCKKT